MADTEHICIQKETSNVSEQSFRSNNPKLSSRLWFPAGWGSGTEEVVGGGGLGWTNYDIDQSIISIQSKFGTMVEMV